MSNVSCRAMSVLGCQPAALKIRKSCTQDCCDGENCISWFDKQFSRLAAYEDTGKSPEEIISILEDYKDLSEQYANFVREMQPIQEAKEEGRLIVLPRDGQHVQGGKEICAFCLHDYECEPGETICGATYKGFKWRGLNEREDL